MNSEKHTADTVEMPVLTPPTRPATGSALVRVDLAAQSHRGRVRAANEDHYLVTRFSRSLETLLTSLPPDEVSARTDEVGYSLLVADGVGGAAAGETASRLAITTLISELLQTRDWIMGNESPDVEQVMGRFAERFRRVHAALRDQGSADPTLEGMGTTMTLACSLGTSLIVGHVGDSRAYLFRGGQLHQLTHDHTYVQALMDLGHLSAEDAARHPLRHVLTRSLGGSQKGSEGDFQHAPLADGDQLLLCTDGLTNMVDDATVGRLLAGAGSADEACQALVAAALDGGGKDNVTVALARYHFPT
jgi:serine/threonine protein phosphatase PrpC